MHPSLYLRSFSALSILALLCAGCLDSESAAFTGEAVESVNGSVLSVTAEADAYTQKTTDSTTNLRTKDGSRIFSDLDNDQHGHMRFKVTKLNRAVRSAKIKLWFSNGSKNGPDIYPTSNTWNETGSLRPARTGAMIQDAKIIPDNSYFEYDVTSAVKANGTFSFELASITSDGCAIYSSETSKPPTLIVTMSDVCVATTEICDGKDNDCDNIIDEGCPVVSCGDRACNGTETCTSCPIDCGTCPATCGDRACNGSETCTSCPTDCGVCAPVCGDRTCNGTETCSSCPADCGTCSASYTFIGTGDIGEDSDVEGQDRTGALIRSHIAGDSDAMVFTLGDNAYPNGTLSQFREFYDPYWGDFRMKTRPTPGNHDYRDEGVAGYLNYFCPSKTSCSFPGGEKKLHYSYTLGDWLLLALDSEHEDNRGSSGAQVAFIKAEMAKHPTKCVLAYWHKPHFSSGHHGNSSASQYFWRELYAGKADVVLAGHEHSYERFAKQNPSQVADAKGIRQFIVGTGGAGRYEFDEVQPNSEVRLNNAWGVIKFELKDGEYSWEFFQVGDPKARDSGSGTCNK